MPKQIYNWSSVVVGDIISFRYKGNKPTAKLTTLLVMNPKLPFVKKVGNIKVVSGDDQIYRIVIENVGNRGARPQVYNEIKRYIIGYSVYRTYDFIEARKSQVFLEPISLPKGLREALIEN